MERDELGHFKPGHTVSPEHQEKMKQGKLAKKLLTKSDTLNTLLQQMGFDPDNVDVDIVALAELFLAGKTNAMGAHSKLIQRSTLFKEKAIPWNPDDGTPCPVCGGRGMANDLTLDDVDHWIASLKELIELKGGGTEVKISPLVREMEEREELTAKERGWEPDRPVAEPYG